MLGLEMQGTAQGAGRATLEAQTYLLVLRFMGCEARSLPKGIAGVMVAARRSSVGFCGS